MKKAKVTMMVELPEEIEATNTQIKDWILDGIGFPKSLITNPLCGFSVFPVCTYEEDTNIEIIEE